MPSQFEVRGVDKIEAVGRALRQAGDQGKGLRREVYAGANRSTKPVRKQMIDAIPAALPKRGGLAAEIHRTTTASAVVRTGGRSVGASIKIRNRKHGVRRLNRGEVRHLVFGRKDSWVTQTKGIRAGFLDRPFRAAKPLVARQLMKALDEVASRIVRKV